MIENSQRWSKSKIAVATADRLFATVAISETRLAPYLMLITSTHWGRGRGGANLKTSRFFVQPVTGGLIAKANDVLQPLSISDLRAVRIGSMPVSVADEYQSDSEPAAVNRLLELS